MEFDTDRSTVFKIFNKKTKQWERKEFVADPVMIIHTINAFEDAKGNIKDLFIYTNISISYAISWHDDQAFLNIHKA